MLEKIQICCCIVANIKLRNKHQTEPASSDLISYFCLLKLFLKNILKNKYLKKYLR